MSKIYAESTLPGIEVSRSIDLAARNAFARVPTLDYFGVDASLFDLVTPEAEQLSDPHAVLSGLFNAKSPHAVDGVVLGAAEYSVVPRNLDALTRQVGARTLRAQVEDPRTDSDRISKSERSGAHALESKLPKLRNLYRVYGEQVLLLNWMQKEIKNHWMAHTNELDMRTKAVTTRGIFDGMFMAIADSEKWNSDTRKSVDAAHQESLLTGTFANKKQYWREMVDVAKTYTEAKRTLVYLRGTAIKKRVQ